MSLPTIINTSEMPEEIKAEWVAALRSGNYAQGVGLLRSQVSSQHSFPVEKFCCLGVLCEIAVEHGVIEPGILDEETARYTYVNREPDSSNAPYLVPTSMTLPGEVQKWAGLPGWDQRLLATWNDKGWTFAEIAAAIEGPR